jgi:hypothetical protein
MTIADVEDLEIGKAAEHLVVADLILAGYRAFLSDQGLPYDVIIDDGGSLYRVQVKATRGLKAVPQRSAYTPGYLFHTRRAGKGGRRRYRGDEFDLLALVALDIRVIAYMRFADVPGCLILRPPNSVPHHAASRPENINQFPIHKALAEIGQPDLLSVLQ